MSFNLDAGGLDSHGIDDLAKKHLDHECIAFKEVCGTGQKQITFNLVPLDRGDRICRRGCRRHAAAVDAVQAAAAAEKRDAGL